MSFFDTDIASENNFIFKDSVSGVSLYIKREDCIHPEVSGNKFRKLKYNIAYAKTHNYKTLLTYGGAYSNHITATAKAGQLAHLKTIGVIRGEELALDLPKTLAENPTLAFAHTCGMQLFFVSREAYREKGTPQFREHYLSAFESYYEIPEGGTNDLAIKGCKEILSKEDQDFDVICSSVGTGGTIAGLIEGAFPNQKVFGFPALKGDFLEKEIKKYTQKTNWELVNKFHFGGYGKVNQDLIAFINNFKKEYQIPLDPVYTGKMIFGIMQLIETGYFSQNTRILAIHTGGLQGIAGMNKILNKKGLSLIV